MQRTPVGPPHSTRTPDTPIDNRTVGCKSTADQPHLRTVTIGNAGHVDHGKSSLVKALTGVDPDTLPEEKAREMTIALGFAPLRLPSGRLLNIVDVPGHDSLVRIMAKGTQGMDAVLLCIACNERVMPQTREHLDVLRLLGIQRGLLALIHGHKTLWTRDALTDAREALIKAIPAPGNSVPLATWWSSSPIRDEKILRNLTQ